MGGPAAIDMGEYSTCGDAQASPKPANTSKEA